MTEYKISVDCINQKTYEIIIPANDESEAMNKLFANPIIVLTHPNVIEGINTKHICFAQIVKK